MMVMVVPMPMIMIMIMPVIVTVRMTAMRMVGAARRLESFADLRHRCAETFEHGANDMVAQNEDAVFLDLCREVPIAEVPGKLDQMPAIARLDLEQLFRSGNDLDQLAVFAHQQVAIGEEDRLFQIEHYHLAVFEMQQLAAQMPEIMR